MGKTLLSLWGLQKPPSYDSPVSLAEKDRSLPDSPLDTGLNDKPQSAGKDLGNPLCFSEPDMKSALFNSVRMSDDATTGKVMKHVKNTMIVKLPCPPNKPTSKCSNQTSFFCPQQTPKNVSDCMHSPKETTGDIELATPPLPSRPKRVLIVSLKCGVEKLKSIHPKRHSFFQQRVGSQAKTVTEKTNVLKPVPKPIPILPCFPSIHVIDSRGALIRPLRRRRRWIKYPETQSTSRATVLLAKGVDNQIRVSGPKLLKTSHAGVDSILETTSSTLNTLHPFVKEARTTASQQTSFDRCESETLLWADKYAPQSARVCLHSIQAREVRDWVKQRSKDLKSSAWRTARDTKLHQRVDPSLGDFIVADNDDEVSIGPSALIICGPSGQGKTSSVYAIAQELGSFVLESNNSDKRTGKALIDLIEGIGQSKAVHSSADKKSGRDCIVLIDEVDALFEAEAQSYWAALEKLVKVCRRPVIMTCENLDHLPASLTDSRVVQICYYRSTTLRHVGEIAWNIAIKEGHVLDRASVDLVAARFRGDLRKTLLHLQFWCQMALGGRKSGIDWMICPEERAHVDRVISVNTPIVPPQESHELSTPPTSISDAVVRSEILSLYDRKDIINEELESDLLNGVPFPVTILTQSINSVDAKKDVETLAYLPTLHKMNPGVLYQNIPSYDEGVSEMALELASYYRHFARCDRHRQAKLDAIRTEGSRSSRRSWATIGLDSRTLVHDWKAVLGTFRDMPELNDLE